MEHIQQQAMLPDKEAKNITYKLLEENFIQMQELRKPSAGSSSGPNKAFFLFYVDINVVNYYSFTLSSIFDRLLLFKHFILLFFRSYECY